MDLGDIVSAAWFLYVRHLSALLSMAAVTVAGALAANLGLLSLSQHLPAQGAQPALVPHAPTNLVLLLIPGLLVLLFNQLALVRYSIGTFLGAELRISRCYLEAAKVYASVLVVVMLLVLLLSFSGISIFTAIIGLPIALYFLVSWFFIGQVCLAEGERSAVRAMRRSQALVRGSWWRTAGVLLGLTLLGLLPGIIASAVPTQAIAGSIAASAIATGFATPFAAASQTMLYLDLRVRKHELIALTPGRSPESL